MTRITLTAGRWDLLAFRLAEEHPTLAAEIRDRIDLVDSTWDEDVTIELRPEELRAVSAASRDPKGAVAT
jgi:hypothetical protein